MLFILTDGQTQEKKVREWDEMWNNEKFTCQVRRLNKGDEQWLQFLGNPKHFHWIYHFILVLLRILRFHTSQSAEDSKNSRNEKSLN